jgi:transcriptional regulator with PAS, ATPase and Fis domain
VGVLYADTLDMPGAFVDGDRELINGLAHLLAAALEKAQDFQRLKYKSGEPKFPGSRRLRFPGVVGESRRMQKIFRLAMAAARTDKTVILTGEPGTGKEVMADIIQQHSQRARLNYLKINCAAVPEHNFESELFGVAAGAFTGVMAREGVFETASGGTLFLDEIGELSQLSQSKLLRVLEEKYIRRVGGKRMIAVDVRILAATNTDLEKAVAEGKFRKDLFDRLNQFAIHLPPLREHQEDIRALAYHFLSLEKDEEGIGRELAIYPPVLDWLEDSPLPGNAREVANIIGKMAALDVDGTLSWDDLPPDVKAQRRLQSPKFDDGSSFDNMMAIAEASILRRALDNADGRIRKAARSLEMPEATLRRRLKMLDLHHPTMFQMRRQRRPRQSRRVAQ